MEKICGGVAMFTRGSAGDVNPSTSRGYICEGTAEDAGRMGTVLGLEAVKVAERIETVSEARIGARSEKVLLVLGEKLTQKEKAARMVEEYRELINRLKVRGSPLEIGHAEKELSYATAMLRHWIGKAPEEKGPASRRKKAEIQVVTANDIALVGIPGESFVETGLAIKKKGGDLGFNCVLPVDLANDSVGYIPTPQAYNDGGYEPYIARLINQAPDAAERIVETATSLLKRCKPRRATAKKGRRDVILWHVPTVGDWEISRQTVKEMPWPRKPNTVP